MGIFDPKTDTSVAYEQPVQQPQSMGLALANVGADIAGGILKAKASGQGGGQGEDYSDEWAMHNFQLEIQKANAARSKEKFSRAEKFEREAVLNGIKYGLDQSDMENAFSALTGRPGEELLFSQEEIMKNKVMATPEYESAFVATYAKNKDASPEERHQLAMAQVARQQGQVAILSDQSISWTQGKRDAFFSAVDDFENAALGSLNQMAQQNGFADLQTIRQSEIMWQQMKGGFLSARPEGTTDKQWNQFEARMSQVDETFDTLKEISSDEGISALAASELAAGIQSKEDWTPGMKVIAKTMLGDAMALGTIKPSKVSELVGSLIDEDFEPGDGGTTGFDEDGEPVSDLIPKSIQDTLKAEDAETSFERAKNLTKVAGGGESSKITSDPTYRKDFFKTTQIAFSAMVKIGEENRRFLTADGISEVFNGKIVEGLRAAGKTDPVRARATAEEGVKALDKQFGIASSQLANSLRGTALRLSPDGQLTLNREAMLEEVSPEMFDRLEKQADDYYDGNLLNLVKDRGRRIPRREFDPATDDPMGLPTVVPGSIVTKALGDLDMVRSQLRSVKAIQNKRDEFRLLANEFIEEGGEGQDQAEGSQGGDTLSFEGNTLDLIKEFEGFRESPYWDVNAFRVGYGSDTITKPDGTVVQVEEGVTVSREDAERDLRRRAQEFATGAKRQVGSEVWTSYPSNVRAALTSIAYNYGSLPERILEEARSGDTEALASAVEGLAGDNEGINKERRMKEAAIIRGGPIEENGQLLYTPRPVARPETHRNTGGDTGSVSGSEGGSTSSVGGSGVDVPVGAQVPATASPEGSSEEVTRSAEEDKESSSKINEQQRSKVMRILKAQGVDTDAISKFNSVEAAQEAIDKGELKEGDLYEVNGEIEVVEKA